jgi:hypothetical protein
MARSRASGESNWGIWKGTLFASAAALGLVAAPNAESLAAPAKPNPDYTEQFRRLHGKQLELPAFEGRSMRFGALVYVAESITKCNLSAKLPGTELGLDLVPVYFIFPEAPAAGSSLPEVRSKKVRVLFDLRFNLIDPSLFSCAPLLLKIDPHGRIERCLRPVRVGTIRELKRFAGVPS